MNSWISPLTSEFVALCGEFLIYTFVGCPITYMFPVLTRNLTNMQVVRLLSPPAQKQSIISRQQGLNVRSTSVPQAKRTSADLQKVVNLMTKPIMSEDVNWSLHNLPLADDQHVYVGFRLSTESGEQQWCQLVRRRNFSLSHICQMLVRIDKKI